METENHIFVVVKDDPEMVFKENKLGISYDNEQNDRILSATNTMKFTDADHINTEEDLSFQQDLDEKPKPTPARATYYKNYSSVVPYEVNIKSYTEMLYSGFKYEMAQNYIKQEPDLDSEQVNEDLNIKTEIFTTETNNYDDIDQQEIKNEELDVKFGTDFDAIDINIHNDLEDTTKYIKSATQIWESTGTDTPSTTSSSQKTSKIHQCPKCSYNSEITANLHRHMIKHKELTTDLEKFYCYHCVYSTYIKSDLGRHMVIHNNSKPYLCAICNKGFKQKQHIDSHIVNNHCDNEQLMATITYRLLECPQCSYKSIASLMMKRHMLKHNEIKSVSQKINCEFCQYSTYLKSDLTRHVLIHRNDKPHGCVICSKSFKHKKQIDSHIVSNHADKEHLMATITHTIYECQQCSYKCICSLNLKRHLLKHNELQTEFQRFNCEHCEYSTYVKSDLPRHAVIHSTDKPHICRICGKGFDKKRYIDFHIASNHAENKELMATITHKMQKCQQCSYTCLTNVILRRHMLKHDQIGRHAVKQKHDKPHVCPICVKSFRSKTNLDSHIVSKHADDKQLMATITQKILECQQCSYKCVFSINLKRHMITHKGELTNIHNIFKCEHCLYSTSSKIGLRRHSLIHSNN